MTFDFSPFLPWPVLAALAAIGAVIAVFSIWRGIRGAWIRTLAALALLGAATAGVGKVLGERKMARSIALEVRPLVAFRDYHSLTQENDALSSAYREEPGAVRMTTAISCCSTCSTMSG